jgi:AcrR family transcriptional regulator
VGITERRERDRERRQEAILDAAERVFLRDGYDASTMESVAREAEVSKGTVYLYFEGKDALHGAIAARSIGRLTRRFEDRLSTCRTGLDGIRALLESYRDHFAERPERCRLASAWLSQPPGSAGQPGPEPRARLGQLIAAVVETIHRGVADGSIRADVDPPVLALQLWAGFLGVSLLDMNRAELEGRLPEPMDLSSLVPAYVETLLRGIAGPAVDPNAIGKGAA